MCFRRNLILNVSSFSNVVGEPPEATSEETCKLVPYGFLLHGIM